MKLTPQVLLNITLVIAMAAMAHGALAAEPSPIFGSETVKPFQLDVDPVTGKPLIMAGR